MRKPAPPPAKGRGKKKEAIHAANPKSAWWCLGIACAYVGLSFWTKSVAERGFREDLARRGTTWQRLVETPAPFNILFWRGLVARDGEIWLGYRSVFDDAKMPVNWTVIPRNEALAHEADKAGAREVDAVEDYSGGWWIARPAAEGLWLADLSHAEEREWDKKGMALRPEMAWTFSPQHEGDRLRRHWPAERDGAETARRIGRRIAGEAGAWDGNARLVGPFLALQEYLATAKEGK